MMYTEVRQGDEIRMNNRKILVYGSLNIDRTYFQDHLVRPGETISATKMEEFCGGKGFNQAIALRRAGNEVWFAGAVGTDGGMILDELDRNGIHRGLVREMPCATGHAVIQVDNVGQNSIVILAGANGTNDAERVDEVLACFGKGDLVVLQNEIPCVEKIIREAHEKGMLVAYNPSPFNEKCLLCDLSQTDILMINETEGEAMTGTADPRDILEILHDRYPQLKTVLTLGSRGSLFMDASGTVHGCGIHAAKAVDTTAAGDTFTGYFLTGYLQEKAPEESLRIAAVAAGISVSRKGAGPSIPTLRETEEMNRTAELTKPLF